MPQPTLSDVHVNALLTNLSLMYAQEESNYVAGRVFPAIPVSKISDKYAIYSRADFNRNTMRKRAPSTESAGGGYRITTASYLIDVWSLHKDIDDQIRANADAVFNLDSDATRWLTQQVLTSKEVAWATGFFGASIWTTNWTGVASAPGANQILQWNDPNSNPIIDIRNFKRTIQLVSTYRPNKMVMSRYVFDVLCDHPDFVDRIKYGQTPGRPAQVTLDAMAGLFELDEVLVMDAILNSGGEGAGPDSGGTDINSVESNSFIASKGVLLTYTPSAPGLQIPGAGYEFVWTGYFGSAGGNRIKSFYIPQIEATRVEVDAAYAFKLVSGDMGGFIASAVA